MTKDEKNLIIGALNSLGCALADHHHQWSDGERAIYEEALRVLGVETEDFPAFEDAETDDDNEDDEEE